MINCDYLYDKSFFEDVLRVERFSDRALSYSIYENGYVVPLFYRDGANFGGVYTSEKDWIASTIYDAKKLTDREITAESYCDETVIYIGWQNSVWGHTITDNLKYLWFIYSQVCREKYAGCKLVYIKNAKEPLGFSKSMARLFEILEIDRSDFVPIERTTQFRRIILPDECFFKDENARKHYTKEYQVFIEKVRSFQRENFREDMRYDKVYYTYSKSSRGRVVGEKKLEDFFARQGYLIIAPEEHSLDEQLHILANCHHFASTIGSCSHNTIFLPEKASVVLIPRAFYLTEYQPLLDSMVNLNVFYVDASLSVLVKRAIPMMGPFYYYESEQLRRCFGIETPCDAAFWRRQLKDFRRYLLLGSTYRGFSERYMPEYYSRQLSYCIEKYREANGVGMFVRRCILVGPRKIKRVVTEFAKRTGKLYKRIL